MDTETVARNADKFIGNLRNELAQQAPCGKPFTHNNAGTTCPECDAQGITAANYPERIYIKIRSTSAGQKYWGFNGGGTATARQMNYLRALIRSASESQDASDLKRMLTELDRDGDRIDRQFVSAAIEILTAS